MKKRLLFLVPAVAMLLAGCGKSGGDPTSTSGEAPTSGQPTSTSGTPTEPGPDSSSSVEPTPDVEPAEIYLSPSNRANLIVGQEMQFTAEVRNQAHSADGVDQRVTWEIAAADEGKYTCVNGLVTAVAPGQDMILTVKSVAKDTVTKTITININKADRALPSETSDGFSLLTSANLSSFENGSEVYFAGVVEDDVWMAKAQSGNNVPAEKAEVNEGGKLVPSANAVKWVVSFNADETVTFTRNSKVLYTPNTGNHLKEAATSAEGVEEAMYHFELTDLDAEGNAVAKSKYVSDDGADQTANIVRFNNTNKYDGQLSPIFSAYKPTSSVKHTFAMYFKAPVVLSSIEVKTQPTVKDYFVGDEFSSAGLEVEAVYSDLHKEALTAEDYELSIADGKALVAGDSGEVTVTLKSDNSKTCTFDITVTPVATTGITVVGPENKEYIKGSPFNTSTITVTLNHNDSRKDRVLPFKSAPEVDGYELDYDFSTAGENKTVTVTYGGHSQVLQGFTVIDKTVTKIEFYSGPEPKVYYLGDTFDRSTIAVKATFNDGTEDTNFDGYQVSPAGPYDAIGTFPVTVYFNAEGTEIPEDENLKFQAFSITVKQDTIVSIALDTSHTDTQFAVEETFNYMNLKAIATHESGKVDEAVPVDQAFIYAPDDTEFNNPLNYPDPYTFVEGDYGKTFTVRASYAGVWASYTVDLRDTVKSMEVKAGSTHKVAFKSGETFSRENLVLDGLYYSGDHYDITNNFTTDWDGHVFTDDDLGPQTVTVNYYGKTCQYSIGVGYAGLVEPGLYYIAAYAGDGTNPNNIAYAYKNNSYVNATLDSSNAYPFELIQVGSNKYKIKLGAEYMIMFNDNNGVRLAAADVEGDTYEFTVAAPTRGEVGYTISAWTLEREKDGQPVTARDRYLSLYNDQNFRCYDSPTASNRKADTLLIPYEAAQSVTLDKGELELTVGEADGVLTPTVLPEGAVNKGVVWTSSDDSVATVSNGVVHPVSNGTCVITATTKDGSHTDTCDVTVLRPKLVSFSIESNDGTIENGGSVTMTATPVPLEADLGTVTYTALSSTNVNATIVGNTIQCDLVDASADGLVVIRGNNGVKNSSNDITISVAKTGGFVLDHIEIPGTSTHKTTYKVGETFDKTGLIVLAYGTNGGAMNVTDDANTTYSGFDSSKAVAEQTITVTYTKGGNTRSTTFIISVKSEFANISVSFASSTNTGTNSYTGQTTVTSGDYTYKTRNASNNSNNWTYYKIGKKSGSSTTPLTSHGSIESNTKIEGKFNTISVDYYLYIDTFDAIYVYVSDTAFTDVTTSDSGFVGSKTSGFADVKVSSTATITLDNTYEDKYIQIVLKVTNATSGSKGTNGVVGFNGFGISYVAA